MCRPAWKWNHRPAKMPLSKRRTLTETIFCIVGKCPAAAITAVIEHKKALWLPGTRLFHAYTTRFESHYTISFLRYIFIYGEFQNHTMKRIDLSRIDIFITKPYENFFYLGSLSTKTRNASSAHGVMFSISFVEGIAGSLSLLVLLLGVFGPFSTTLMLSSSISFAR